MPWLIVLDASVDHTGYFRIQLKRDDIPLTPRLRASFMVNTDREYMVGGRYIGKHPSKYTELTWLNIGSFAMAGTWLLFYNYKVRSY
jgi:hypothetical protein